ncbi:MAG: CheR family methyltransferase [Hyphomicrobiaceae bacterium]
MSRLKAINYRLFRLAPLHPVGRKIYALKRRTQTPSQSTSTKFFRNLNQLQVFEGPLRDLTSRSPLRILVTGCSLGCEAFTIAGYLLQNFKGIEFEIDAIDIDKDAIAHAQTAMYTQEHGIEQCKDQRQADTIAGLQKRMFENVDQTTYHIKPELRRHVHFTVNNVLSQDLKNHRQYDCVFGQNYMIHMNTANAQKAFRTLIDATRPGGVLFAGGIDLDLRTKLSAQYAIKPVSWNIEAIHDADWMRRAAWPWTYWSLEPINPKAENFAPRYATIFRKHCST